MKKSIRYLSKSLVSDFEEVSKVYLEKTLLNFSGAPNSQHKPIVLY